MSSPIPDLPPRMLRDGRPIDPHFEPDELLYRRCPVIDITIIDNRESLNPIGLQFRNLSVNRGKYSEPGDVLLPNWPTDRIAVLQVGRVEKQLSHGGGPVFDFRMLHEPEERNYAHSALKAFKNGVLQLHPNPSQEVKKQIRQIIADNAIILPVAE